MTKEKLDQITTQLIWDIYRNPNVAFCKTDNEAYLLDVVASLHNVLYKEVTGESYDYMFHWLNKCTGGVDLNDKMFMLEDMK